MRRASPVFHVDGLDPPSLTLRGDQDIQTSVKQAHELHHAYKEHHLEVQFEVVHRAAHGGEHFRDEKRNALVTAFLDKYLN